MTGTVTYVPHGHSRSLGSSGVFTVPEDNSIGFSNAGGKTQTINYDASRASSVYNKSITIQPSASYALMIIKE